MGKRSIVALAVFVGILAIAYPLIKSGRENHFVLSTPNGPTSMVYSYGNVDLGDERVVEFSLRHETNQPFQITECRIGFHTEFDIVSHPTLNVPQTTHVFRVKYRPTKAILQKNEINISTDKGSFLIDISGVGILPEYRLESIRVNGKRAVLSLSNRTVYVSSATMPSEIRIDYTLTQPGRLVWNNREIESGDLAVLPAHKPHTISFNIVFVGGGASYLQYAVYAFPVDSP